MMLSGIGIMVHDGAHANRRVLLDQTVYRFGSCTLDSANRRFTRDGRDYDLEPKVFAVLVQLVMRPAELVTRDQLLDAVWGHRYVTSSTLNRVISLARRALADDADRPNLIQTVHGAGYRYTGPVEQAAASAEPRARFAPPASARLPARLQSLIGRAHELAQIEALLQDGRSLTLLGTGGMGKTQCALAFAHERADLYPDGIWFFDLVPVRRAEDWLQALALALSIAPSGQGDLLDKVAETLRARQALLLLDNCDRLSAELGALIIEILRATDKLRVLATSQQQLKYVGERLLRMPPLRLPAIRRPSGEADLVEVAAAPAVTLLLARIGDTQTDFKLTIANAPAIVDICERLDGMPLAIELAAARFSLLSPDQVLERLDQRFRFLVSDVAGRDHRHRNLVALLEWSFRLLSSDEQRLLAWLGVFVQGWTVDAMIDLASPFGSTPEIVVDLLNGLVNKSLVAVDQSISPPRYRMLESVREFALEQLKAAGEERRARDAHLAYVVHMIDTAHQDMLGGRMRERIALIMPEHGNIDSASEHAVGAANDGSAALRIAGLLTLYFKAHGETELAKRLCERALCSVPLVRTRERGLALMCLGVAKALVQKNAGDQELMEAAGIADEVGDDWAAAYSRGTLALWQVHMGRAVEAAQHLTLIERVATQFDDELLRGLAGLVRGWLYLADGDMDRSIDVLRSVRHRGGDFHQHHFIDTYIGLALFRRGDYGPAAAYWLEGMRNGIAVGHIRGVGGAIEGCAYIAERMGKAEEACRFLSAAAQIRQRAASPLFSFWIRHNEFANSALRSALGARQYEAATNAGAQMRQEDAVNEAADLLREFGGSAVENGLADSQRSREVTRRGAGI
jgi:predicted ATPase/DNA-binding winged helix-turn-helix (wHTH) protein